MNNAPANSGLFAPWSARWRSVVLLVLSVTLFRLLYLALWCPYTLIEDEAHYWEWSRRLALSYYTKGPGVAWTIAATTRVIGDTEFGVRFASPIASGVGALAVALLARECVRDRRVPFFAAACWLLVPLFQLMGLLLTIDGPYCACWAVAMFAGARALRTGSLPAWAGLGVALGVGALYKYTILLAIPGLLFTWWWQRRHRQQQGNAPIPSHAGMALCGVLFAACMLPIIIWNQHEGWPTIKHLLGHLGVEGGDMPVRQGAGSPDHRWHYDPMWTINLVASQLGMVGPILILGLMESWRVLRGTTPRDERPGEVFLLAGALPILIFYLLVSFIASPEANWPMAGFITLMPLAARRIVLGMEDWNAQLRAWRALPKPRPHAGVLLRRPETPTQVLWHITIFFGLVAGIASLRLDLVAGVPGLRKVIPLHRFMWADVMARHVERLAGEVAKETNQQPLIISQAYGRASQFAFYLPGHPVVYCPGARIDGRRTQYDYFPDTNFELHPELLGRPAILVGAWQEAWEKVFDRVTPLGTLDGEGKRNRPAFKGYGFRGFPK